jgi:hypothetical protein
MESSPSNTDSIRTGGGIVKDTIEVDLDALRQLHAEAHPERQPGEFTTREYMEANADKNMTYKEASYELESLERIGKVIKPPKRYIDSKLVVVYKLV